MPKKAIKTNVMRLLDQKGIAYNVFTVDIRNSVDGITMAKLLKQDEKRAFKTLVTQGSSGEHYVFAIPVSESLNLKKAAISVGEKSIKLISPKELLSLTGYVHGGCSPIGMKKQFETVFHQSAFLYDTIYFSAGRVGVQIEVNPRIITELFNFSCSDLVGN